MGARFENARPILCQLILLGNSWFWVPLGWLLAILPGLREDILIVFLDYSNSEIKNSSSQAF